MKAEAKPPVSEQDSAKSTIAAAKVRQEATKRPDTASKGQKAEAMNVENDMPGLQSDEEEVRALLSFKSGRLCLLLHLYSLPLINLYDCVIL